MTSKFIKLTIFTFLLQFLISDSKASNFINQEFNSTSGFSFSHNLKTLNNYSLLNTEELQKKRRSSKGRGRRGRNCYSQGTTTLTLGCGFPNLTKVMWSSSFSYEDGYKVTGYGPFHFKAEYGLSDNISMGVSIGYVCTNWSWENNYTDYEEIATVDDYGYIVYDYKEVAYSYTEGLKYSALNINARLNVHFLTSQHLDPYMGLGIGYNKATFNYYSNDPDYVYSETISSPIPLGFEVTLGLRYYFTPNIGIYAEAGLSKSILQSGLAIKF